MRARVNVLFGSHPLSNSYSLEKILEVSRLLLLFFAAVLSNVRTIVQPTKEVTSCLLVVVKVTEKVTVVSQE
jgi:hypothetical protein